jgi:seryl-tRNA synthetase
MLDIKLIRDNSELVKKNLKRRGDKEVISRLDELIKKDKKWRDLIKQVDKLKHERNVVSREIANLKKSGKDAKKEMKRAGEIPRKLKSLEEERLALENTCRDLLLRIPNMLHESVPCGKDDSDNKVVRKKGKVPKIKNPKDHMQIAQELGLVDRDRGNKVAGHGFLYLKGKLAILDLALQRYAIDFLMKRGFNLVEPPFMIRKKIAAGATDLSDFGDVLYKIDGEDLYPIATSEHPLVGMFAGETLLEKDLPVKLVGVSPCFRKEVGTHGKYTKGLFRMHQFNKVEEFVFCKPEQSWQIHEELQKITEELLDSLGLCYRVVNVCTGDIGIIAAKKYDVEFWMADGEYRELSSNSNATGYQARRLGIKYKEKDGSVAKGFVHTVNNTAVATSRIMVAILEQFQQDGSVIIPKVLHKYCGFKEIKKK